jgi:hypothetical protein
VTQKKSSVNNAFARFKDFIVGNFWWIGKKDIWPGAVLRSSGRVDVDTSFPHKKYLDQKPRQLQTYLGVAPVKAICFW